MRIGSVRFNFLRCSSARVPIFFSVVLMRIVCVSVLGAHWIAILLFTILQYGLVFDFFSLFSNYVPLMFLPVKQHYIDIYIFVFFLLSFNVDCNKPGKIIRIEWQIQNKRKQTKMHITHNHIQFHLDIKLFI